MKKYKNCQSCGMPMSKDPERGGSEEDGVKNKMYFSYCYQNGTFTQPDFTAKEMQHFCQEKMKEMSYPRLIAGLFTLGIPRLKRWNTK